LRDIIHFFRKFWYNIEGKNLKEGIFKEITMSKSTKKSMKKKVILIVSIVIFVLLAVAVGVSYYFLPTGEVVARGVKINEVNIGNMAYGDIAAKVMPDFESIKTDIVVDDVKMYTLTADDMMLEQAYEDAILRAKQVGKEGGIVKRVIDTATAFYYGKNIKIVADEGFSAKIEEILTDLSKKASTIEPQDARLDLVNGEIVIEKEITGKAIDIEESKKLIEKDVLGFVLAAKSAPEKIEIVAKLKNPEVTAKDLEKYTTLLGTFSTNLSGSSGRVANITLSAKTIDGTVLKPGDTFSFNKVVGPRTTERGYRIAPVISDGQSVPGIGGGICQTSTTLYNAVLYSNLKVVERRPHTIPSSYVPSGRDATVSYGSTDFKFQNDRDSDIMLFTRVANGKITATIVGSGEKPKVEIVRSNVAAMSVTVSKVITNSDGTKTTVHVSNDRYSPAKKPTDDKKKPETPAATGQIPATGSPTTPQTENNGTTKPTTGNGSNESAKPSDSGSGGSGAAKPSNSEPSPFGGVTAE